MPMGKATRASNNYLHISDRMVEGLLRNGHFNRKCTLQNTPNPPTRTPLGGIVYGDWEPIPGYIDIPCAVNDNVLRGMRAAVAEGREAQDIQELLYWEVMLAGYFPGVNPAWRAVLETGSILDIMIATHPQEVVTILTCRTMTPVAQEGV